MRFQKIASVIIFLAAVAIGGFVIYDNTREDAVDENKQNLDSYLEQGGIEREESQSEPVNGNGSIQVGGPAIDFKLPDVDGEQTVSLSGMEGNYVVLNMWASWCPPCRDEMPDFISFYEKYKDEGVEVVGINMTTQERNVEAVEQFVDDFNIPFYTLLDEDGTIGEQYEVRQMPTTYIIDPDGNIAMRRPGLINFDMLEAYYHDIRADFEESS